jgi:hypothetical protein
MLVTEGKGRRLSIGRSEPTGRGRPSTPQHLGSFARRMKTTAPDRAMPSGTERSWNCEDRQGIRRLLVVTIGGPIVTVHGPHNENHKVDYRKE